MEAMQLLLSPTLVCFFLYVCVSLLHRCWVRPMILRRGLQRSGLRGPSPLFPFGNILEMKKLAGSRGHVSPCIITHDIHSLAFPHFAQWRKSFGNVFVYWLGTEPLLYVGEPEFIKQMMSTNQSKSWGKPSVFREDRRALFGNGLLMLEGDSWSHRRKTLSPAFFPSHLKNMSGLIVDSASNMLDNWRRETKDGSAEINVENDLLRTTADVIAKTTFGLSYEEVKDVFEQISLVQDVLFRSQRFVGVPFGNVFNPKQSMTIQRLAKEIDRRILSVMKARRDGRSRRCQDLLGLLLEKEASNYSQHDQKERLDQDVVDECKTFLFSGHETTALALTWTMLLLALHKDWQHSLREEVLEITGGQPIDANVLLQLERMTWVMNEVLRLYSPGPNAQRQAKEDIQVGEFLVPKGTNIWLDIVGMNHDPTLWGEDVNEFKPERFREGQSLACKHRLGFIPFGFGVRTCVGQNQFKMEYKLVLSMILTSFSWSLSPNYCHSPSIMLSLRPSFGVPLILRPLSHD